MIAHDLAMARQGYILSPHARWPAAGEYKAGYSYIPPRTVAESCDRIVILISLFRCRSHSTSATATTADVVKYMHSQT